MLPTALHLPSTHLCTWVERGTVRVTWTEPQTTRSGGERTNHYVTTAQVPTYYCKQTYKCFLFSLFWCAVTHFACASACININSHFRDSVLCSLARFSYTETTDSHQHRITCHITQYKNVIQQTLNTKMLLCLCSDYLQVSFFSYMNEKYYLNYITHCFIVIQLQSRLILHCPFTQIYSCKIKTNEIICYKSGAGKWNSLGSRILQAL